MNEKTLSEEFLVELLQQFVRYPTEQTDLQEQDPDVQSFIRECAAPIFERWGLEYRYDSMSNLILEIGPKDTGRCLLFIGYAMTHPASNMPDAFTATRIETAEGPAIRGRGVAEQKSALAAIFGAIGHSIKKEQFNGRLVFVLTAAGETGRHDAVECAMQTIEEEPNLVVACVGTNQRIAIGNKGRVDLDILVKGKTAHSSTPWNGDNAIMRAQKVLQLLDNMDLEVEPHQMFGAATLTPTAIESAPRATHTVPDNVRITFDRRLLPGEDPHVAVSAIRAAIVDMEPKVSVECGPMMYPNEAPLSGDLYRLLEEALKTSGYSVSEPFYSDFALDAGYFANRGADAVMFGPGDVQQFHSDDESVLIAELIKVSTTYSALIKAYLC